MRESEILECKYAPSNLRVDHSDVFIARENFFLIFSRARTGIQE